VLGIMRSGWRVEGFQNIEPIGHVATAEGRFELHR
jgi:hypothetical protein